MESEVQKKLIESAVQVFAQRGYRDAKIAAIVNGAGANIAAVNYYFGSKEKLFVAALRSAYALADAAYPSKGGLADDASAKEKVAELARAVLLRSLDPGRAGDFNRIMCLTMHASDSPIDVIMQEVEGFELKYLVSSMTEFLDTNSQPLVAWAVSTFISLATMISKRPNGAEGILPPESSQEVIDAFVDAQITTIFAALDSLPKQLLNN